MGRVSGPLLDRIDIQVEVNPVKYENLESNEKEETSEQIKERVNNARKIQQDRYKDLEIFSNSELTPKLIDEFCKLDLEEKKILNVAFNKLGLSARAYSRILKVARTIADLNESKNIEINHLEDRAVTHNIGLCDEETKADIAFYIKSNIGGTKLRPSKENGRIQLKRLDDIEFNEDKIDFIKIDVEGLEYKVLNGARNLISKHKPLIFVEVANYDNVMKFFKELGYEIKESFAGSNYLFQYKG